MRQIGGVFLFRFLHRGFWLFGIILFQFGQRNLVIVFRFSVLLSDIGHWPGARGAVHVGVDFTDQVRRRARWLLLLKGIDHTCQSIMAAEQQVGKLTGNGKPLLGQSFKQVLQLMGKIAHRLDIRQASAALEGMQVPL